MMPKMSLKEMEKEMKGHSESKKHESKENKMEKSELSKPKKKFKRSK